MSTALACTQEEAPPPLVSAAGAGAPTRVEGPNGATETIAALRALCEAADETLADADAPLVLRWELYFDNVWHQDSYNAEFRSWPVDWSDRDGRFDALQAMVEDRDITFTCPSLERVWTHIAAGEDDFADPSGRSFLADLDALCAALTSIGDEDYPAILRNDEVVQTVLLRDMVPDMIEDIPVQHHYTHLQRATAYYYGTPWECEAYEALR